MTQSAARPPSFHTRNEESPQYSGSDIRALSEFVATLLWLETLHLLSEPITQAKYC